ncbi:hypothetical protein [Pontibacter indicus]|uniref:Uncharacterized protein n=1 Tax=Pontibacter indicus TaxID=1317125 RepID=A0A1R3XAA7_9BACT|nr:hypothetical protein [Pontibacter indicus]SIT88121.1 hypothetical protein SAMN05444128_1780 [Pontibacter indicus]
MIDKELEAIIKCHEHLTDLDNDSRMRVFKYLFDRYGLLPSQNQASSNMHILTEAYEITEVEDTRETPKKAEQKPKKVATNGKSSKSSIGQSYSLVTSLNLVSAADKSLKEFFSGYETKTNFDYNIVILYYLKYILKEDNINVNHIYTCYKHLGIKVPNIVQSLRDTKNRKGWIDTSNSEDLKVTIAGENYIEHEIANK